MPSLGLIVEQIEMIINLFLESVQRTPDKLAAKDPTRALTYRTLARFSHAMHNLVEAETRREQVGIMLPASVGGLGCILGSLWAGRTFVPLNFLLPQRELAQIVADAGIDLILTTRHFREQLADLPARPIFLEEAGLKGRYLRTYLSRRPRAPEVRPDDVAAIIYTSGTTGLPKGVCLTHRNLVTNIQAMVEHERITPDSVLLGVIPPFHVFGLSIVMLLPAIIGAAVSCIPRFSPQAAYRAIRDDRADILVAVPSMYNALARLKELDRNAFQHVKLAASGGEPLPRVVFDMFRERTGIELVEGYGLTETSPVISANQPWDNRPGTVGRPLANIEVQLRDESNQIIGGTGRGELFTRSQSVMKGYYNKPDETSAVIDDDGWFRTGDIVDIDDEGWITITGRAKDLIISGGENVYPREVEMVLEEHPAVAEAAVFGIPDESRGEVVVAFVTLMDESSADSNALREFCKGRIAGYKTPRQVHICEELPRGPTGKVLKRELKQRVTGVAEAS